MTCRHAYCRCSLFLLRHNRSSARYLGQLCCSKNEVMSNMQAVCDQGIASIDVLASELLASTLSGGDQSARAILKLIIARLAGSLSASLPADAKHKQHLSRLALWLQSGKKRKGLQLDCAGLTLAVFCLSQMLIESIPCLADVRMSVR